MRTYQFLSMEAKKDSEFFKKQLRTFQIMLAVRAFSDLKMCETLDDTINALEQLIRDCKAKQLRLERMEKSEYKAYISELCGDIEDSDGKKEPTRASDTELTEPKHKITWLA